RAREPRERGRAQVADAGCAQTSARADQQRAAADRWHECALPLYELRVQHQDVHLALSELQALGDGAPGPEPAARELAELAPAPSKLAQALRLGCCDSPRRSLAFSSVGLTNGGRTAMKINVCWLVGAALAAASLGASAGPVNINTADAATLAAELTG